MNTRNEVAKSVLLIVAESLSVRKADLTEQTLIVEDLEASSMDIVTLMVALDDEFDVELNIDEVPQEKVSVGWVIDYIAGKLR